MSSHEDLAALRVLVDAEPAVREGLDDYCLLFVDPGEKVDAEAWTGCPPRRGVLFAQDGSEHEYSLLESGAVLLYTPLSDRPYVVVGADLREFLALLLHSNGAGIGALGYDWEEAADELADGPGLDDEDVSEVERAALARLSEVFGLARWPVVRSRLDELQGLLPER